MSGVRWLIALLAVVCCCGCEADRFPVAPVSGRVLFNGKPLAGAHVLFQPLRTGAEIEAGPESVGLTDADGRFVLKTIEPERNGAMVGKHKVSVTIPEEENRYGGGGGGGASEDGSVNDAGFTGVARYTLPERYRLGTALEVEVPPEGTDSLELNLTSP